MTDIHFSSDSDMVGATARSPATIRSARRSINFLVCQLPLASSLLFDVSTWCHGSLLHIVLYRSLHAGFEFATQYLLCSRLCYKFMSIHRSINCLVYHYPLPHPSCLKLESGVTIHSCTSCSIDPFMQDLSSHYNTYCVVHCVISYPSSNCGRVYLHCRSCEVEYSSSHSEPFNNVWQSGTQAQSTESLQ